MDSLGLTNGWRDIIVLPDGVVLETHGAAKCHPLICCIHNPSDHPLRNAPMRWLPRSNLMVRLCPHGTPHPDPDSRTYLESWGAWITEWHPCCPDRCCEPADS